MAEVKPPDYKARLRELIEALKKATTVRPPKAEEGRPTK